MGRPFTDETNLPARAEDLRQELRRDVEPGETLLWTGFPRQGMILRGEDALLIPFSLLWGGFAVFWEYSVINDGAPFFFMLWGIPFVLVGLWFIAGRFYTDASSRASTIYAVTSRRVLIRSGVWRPCTRSLELLGLAEINLSEGRDGHGTITFGAGSPFAFGMPRGWPGAARFLPPTFEGIPNARQVLQIIRDAQRAALSGRV